MHQPAKVFPQDPVFRRRGQGRRLVDREIQLVIRTGGDPQLDADEAEIKAALQLSQGRFAMARM